MLLRFGSGSVFGSAGDFGSKCQPKIYIHPYVTDVFLVYYENKPFRQFFFWYRLKKNDAWLKKKKKKNKTPWGLYYSCARRHLPALLISCFKRYAPAVG